jgi:hypothetical protein
VKKRIDAKAPGQLRDKECRKVKTHSLGVKKAETAVTAIQVGQGDSGPLLLFIASPGRLNGGVVLLVIDGLRLKQTDAIARMNALKG